PLLRVARRGPSRILAPPDHLRRSISPTPFSSTSSAPRRPGSRPAIPPPSAAPSSPSSPPWDRPQRGVSGGRVRPHRRRRAPTSPPRLLARPTTLSDASAPRGHCGSSLSCRPLTRDRDRSPTVGGVREEVQLVALERDASDPVTGPPVVRLDVRCEEVGLT